MLCEALEELMKDELEANRSRGLSEGRMKGLQEGLAEGRAEGLAEGQQQATDRLNALTLKLAELGRTDDIIKAASDTSYQKKAPRRIRHILKKIPTERQLYLQPFCGILLFHTFQGFHHINFLEFKIHHHIY